MKYYQIQKEEKQIKIRKIINNVNAHEIIDALNEIEERESKSILSYYDFIIDMILMGEEINKSLVLEYFTLYSKLLIYGGEQLKYAIESFKYSLSYSAEDLQNTLFEYLPWYEKIIIRIKRWFKKYL